MRMPVDDRVAAGKRRDETLAPPRCRPRDVDEPDSNLVDVDHAALRQELPEPGLVHVPGHALHRRQRLEPFERGDGDEIAGVQDHIGPLEPAEAFRREPPCPSRRVRVGDDRDQGQPAAPFRNAPLLYTSSPSA
jgi:hypothetical protein